MLEGVVIGNTLIFGMYHLLVDLYHICSYDAPGVKTDPAPGVTSWNIGTKKPIFKIFLLWYWIVRSPVGVILYTFFISKKRNTISLEWIAVSIKRNTI